MTTQNSKRVALFAALGGTLCSPLLLADVWIFEPSISLDQRFDDNYFLLSTGDAALSATRVVGDLGVSRQSEAFSIEGLARIDALYTSSSDVGDDDLDFNQTLLFDARRVTSRSRYGVQLDYTRDTPSRDIAADLSDNSSFAQDTGLDNLTQTLSNNVARQTYNVEPSYQYDISRRLEFDGGASYKRVDHDLPDAQDAIYQQYLASFEAGLTEGDLLPIDEVTIDTVGVGVFSPTGELDDYTDVGFDVGLRYKLTPITTLTATADYSVFTSQVEPNAAVIIPFEDLIEDNDVRQIVRRPERESISKTTTLTVGIERFVTPTLQIKADGGVYSVAEDTTDTLRPDDVTDPSVDRDSLGVGDDTSNGFLASVGLDYDANRTQYSVTFAVDVLPSSSGSQVETNELRAQAVHTLSPRLTVAAYARAYEPDRLGANVDDRFARRFISFEPRIQWQYSRTITLTAAYRYRRQKARVDPDSAESNALLLAIKYTPASKVRDAANASGL